MKYLIYSLCISLLIVSCKKPAGTNCLADMNVNKASASGTTNRIDFVIEGWSPNLCYSFSNLSIQKTADKTYEIRMVASVPCNAQVCAEALYQTIRTGKIENLAPGVYTLHFCTNYAIFTTLTVSI